MGTRPVLRLKPKSVQSDKSSHISPYQEFAERLCVRFPACFSLSNPVPLSIGISEIVALAFNDLTPEQIKRTIKWYCRRKAYHRAMVTHDVRYGIDGQNGEVTEGQRNYHASILRNWGDSDATRRAKERRRKARKRVNRKARMAAA